MKKLKYLKNIIKIFLKLIQNKIKVKKIQRMKDKEIGQINLILKRRVIHFQRA